jgi:polar amino acid transport system substrate-binding protein
VILEFYIMLKKIVGLFLFLVITTVVYADEVWTVASEANFYPYNYWEKGKRTGLDVAIVSVILKDLGVLSVERAVSWSEVVAAVDTGKCDMGYQFTEYWGKKHSPPFILIGPFRYSKTVLMGDVKNKIAISSLQDLEKYRVGIVDGYRYYEEFDANDKIEKLVSASTVVNLRRLLLGRVDFIIGDQNSLLATAESEGKSDYVYISQILSNEPRFFAFPHNEIDKAARFKASFENLKQKGVIDNIIDTWKK